MSESEAEKGSAPAPAPVGDVPQPLVTSSAPSPATTGDAGALAAPETAAPLASASRSAAAAAQFAVPAAEIATLPGGGSPWERALSLQTAGQPPDAIAAELKRLGLDAEAVRLTMNALPGAPGPQELPELRFDQGVNALTPDLLSLLDMGIVGRPLTVALYWVAFGSILAIFVTAVLQLGETHLHTDSSAVWARFAINALPYVAYPISAFALLRAAYLVFRRWL